MKTLLQTLFFFLLVSQMVFAQWYPQNSGTTQHLNAVHFVDANAGWAVGDSGTILHTTNAGLNWEQQMSGTIAPLIDMIFTNELNGWIVGNNYCCWPTYSILLATTDAGLNWVQQIVDTSLAMESVFFLNESFGWIGGVKDTGSGAQDTPVIFRTTNGGNIWDLEFITQGFWGEAINDVYFLNNNIGYAAGGICNIGGCIGSIYKTTDGGETWNEQMVPFYAYQGVVFFDPEYGFAVANCASMISQDGGKILRTQDGGINWVLVYEPSVGDITSWLHDITFYDTVSVWAVGESEYDIGKILYSSDKGENWSSQGAFSNSLNAVDFISLTSDWAVGDSGTILHTTNGGIVPVELISFTAETENQKVILRWATATESNNNGFEIQRKVAESDFATVGFVRGEGTTTNQKEYSFIDKDLVDGKYFYRLKQVDYNGTYEYSNVIEVDVRSLNEYALEQNYPNPFNPTTTIGYVLREKSNAKLILLNAIGEEVAQLVNEEQEQGYHKVDFKATNLSSGIYFYKLKTENFVQVKKMILMK